MLIKRVEECPEFEAGDLSILREVLSPLKDAVSSRYSLAHARVLPGEGTRWHSMKTTEVYYILAGRGEMQIDEERNLVEPGAVIYIPPNSRQRIRNVGNTDLEFLCIVDPAWRREDEIL
jgi:mannose-6-phosphate isomerase-like protein (cupin superfamily)